MSCLVSVLAVDWLLSLQPGLGSSGIGLLLITSQIGVAASFAAFVTATGTRGAVLPAGMGLLLTALLAAWGFMHIVQYLVVWSANLPAEVSWYLARQAGLGIPTIWFAVSALVLAFCVLPTRFGRIPAVAATLAATLLLMHLAETLWLVTPAFRASFRVTLPDILAVLGLGGLLLALTLAATALGRNRGRHAAT